MKESTQHIPYTFGSLFNWTAALLSVAAAAIHFAVLGAHFEEWYLYGLFFAVVAWFQAGWALLVIARPNRGFYVAGVAVNAGVISVWALTRTFGIPVGPALGEVEAVSFSDVAATTFEALLAIFLISLLKGTRWRARKVNATRFWTIILPTALLVMAVTVAALASLGSEEHGTHHHGASVEPMGYTELELNSYSSASRHRS